jgi:hypothetical protein
MRFIRLTGISLVQSQASLIGQAPQKLKGKMARMVATKTALSIRVDALSDADTKSSSGAFTIGIDNRVKLESRLRALEHRAGLPPSTVRSERRDMPKFEMSGTGATYNSATDNVNPTAELLATQPGKSAQDVALEIVKETRDEKKADKKKKRWVFCCPHIKFLLPLLILYTSTLTERVRVLPPLTSPRWRSTRRERPRSNDELGKRQRRL